MDYQKIKGVIFDWGGIIIDEPSRGLQEYCSEKLSCDFEAGCEAIRTILPLYQEARITEKEMWNRVCDQANGDTSLIPANSLWGEALRSVFRFRIEVLECIYLLKQKGYRVGFLSNTEPAAAEFFHERKMGEEFHSAILSCEVQVSKPEQKIYELSAEGMELPMEELVFLDDRPENIEGAQAVGMHGALLAETGEIVAFLKPLLDGDRP